MKNPSRSGMHHISDRMPHLAKSSMTPPVKSAEALERQKHNQEKLHSDFVAMLESSKRVAEAQTEPLAKQHKNTDRPQTVVDAW
jgi:hypothetical protein